MHLVRPISSLLLILTCVGCVELSPSKGGGQTAATSSRRADPGDVAVPAEYRVEIVATGLNMPSGVDFDAQNRPIVVESGYCYGETFATPRVLRVDGNGAVTVLVTGNDGVPWNGVACDPRGSGDIFIAQGGELTGGRIVRLGADAKLTTLIDKLPSTGDHHTNGPAIGPDGSIYFGVGVATNSGVVGEDNFKFGWAKRFPQFHDIPARDIKLAGENFTTKDPPGTSGAFVPFGTATSPGQVIRGQIPCTGAIFRIAPTGGQPQLLAWGLRNPFGLTFAPDGRLLVTENMYDVRGSRPVWGCGDLLRAIDPRSPPLWYGWPDFHGDQPLTWSDHYQPPGHPAPKFLLAEHPNPPPKPAAVLGVHSSACGLDVSRSESFGHVGDAFIALFGDMAPTVGKVMEPVGFQIVRVNPSTGVIEPFAVNRGKSNGPASMLKSAGLERPVAARFDRTGNTLYVVDFGVLTVDKSGAHAQQNTGVLWRITRAEAHP
jgi:glucose/arabinose dehydrogenase